MAPRTSVLSPRCSPIRSSSSRLSRCDSSPTGDAGVHRAFRPHRRMRESRPSLTCRSTPGTARRSRPRDDGARPRVMDVFRLCAVRADGRGYGPYRDGSRVRPFPLGRSARARSRDFRARFPDTEIAAFPTLIRLQPVITAAGAIFMLPFLVDGAADYPARAASCRVLRRGHGLPSGALSAPARSFGPDQLLPLHVAWRRAGRRLRRPRRRPHLFKTVAEYPILLFSALLARPGYSTRRAASEERSAADPPPRRGDACAKPSVRRRRARDQRSFCSAPPFLR